MATILLIDDMDLIRGAIKATLARAGHAVTEARNGRSGIALLQSRSFDLVITDMLMPEADGAEVTAFLHTMPRRPRILAMSGGSADVPAEDALRLVGFQADAVLKKPFVGRDLMATVDRLLAA